MGWIFLGLSYDPCGQEIACCSSVASWIGSDVKEGNGVAVGCGNADGCGNWDWNGRTSVASGSGSGNAGTWLGFGNGSAPGDQWIHDAVLDLEICSKNERGILCAALDCGDPQMFWTHFWRCQRFPHSSLDIAS